MAANSTTFKTEFRVFQQHEKNGYNPTPVNSL